MTSKRYKLGDLCDMVRGISPTMKTEPGTYPLVVTAAYRRTSNAWQLQGPAVCVPLISSTGHGHASLHRVHYQEGKFALANLLVALMPRDPDQCNPKYLYYLLMAKKDELLVPLMSGTANVSLKEAAIAEVEILLPPGSRQQMMVAKIDELESNVSAARTIHSAIDETSTLLLGAVFQKISKGAPQRKMGEVAPLVRRSVIIEAAKFYRVWLSYWTLTVKPRGQAYAAGEV
jgi:hypothetical protein